MKTNKIRENLRKALVVWVTVAMVVTQSPLAYAMEIVTMPSEEEATWASFDEQDATNAVVADAPLEQTQELVAQSSDEFEIAIEFEHAYVYYLDQVIAYPATKIAVPLDREFRFAVQADEGYELAQVECDYVDSNNEVQITTLEPDVDGTYVIDAALIPQIALLSVKAQPLAEAVDMPQEGPVAIEESEDLFVEEPAVESEVAPEPSPEPEVAESATEPTADPAPEASEPTAQDEQSMAQEGEPANVQDPTAEQQESEQGPAHDETGDASELAPTGPGSEGGADDSQSASAKDDEPAAAEETHNEQTSQEEGTNQQEKDESSTQRETPRTKTRYTFEDAAVRVVATAERADALPDDAVLKVTRLTPNTRAYNYDAYLDALNQSGGKKTYDSDNTLLYDVAFLVTDESGNTVEVQPEEGSVRVEFSFKRQQLSEKLAVENSFDLEVTHLPLTSEVQESSSTTASATAISAEDVRVESLASSGIGADGNSVAVTATSFSVYALSNTSLASEGKAVPVSVNFFDYDGQTPAPSAYNGTLYLYLDIVDKKTNEVVGWKVEHINAGGNASVTAEYSTFIRTSANTDNMWMPGDLSFDASKHAVHWVRLYAADVAPSYKNVELQDTLSEWEGVPNDSIDGYKFMHSEVVDGVQNIDLKRWNDGKLNINLTFEPGLSAKITEGDGYWLRVELKHTKTNTTYFVRRLGVQEATDGVATIEANEWRDYNGNVQANEKFTGNEVSVSAQIVHTSQGASEGNVIKNENMCAPIPDGGMVGDYVVSYTSGDAKVASITADNDERHDTEATYVITLTKAPAADDYLTLHDILGDGLNYGIVTERFEMTGGDAETNVAAMRGTSTTQTGNDLTNKVEQTFVLAQIDGEFKIKGESAYVRTTAEDAAKVKSTGGVLLSVDTSSTKDELVAEVRAMLNKGASSSSYFAAQAPNASVVAYNQTGSNGCVVNIAGRGAGTYYVTVDDELYDKICANGRLNIKKDDDQVVVFNVTASTSTIEKYNLNGQGADAFLTNDNGRPDTIVWNFVNSTALRIAGSITGIILAPNATVTVDATSSGWLVAKEVKIGAGEWHNVFQEVVQLRQGTEVTFEAIKQVSNKSSKASGFTFELARRNEGGGWSVLETRQNDGASITFGKVSFDEKNFTSATENQEYLFRIRETKGATDSDGNPYEADQTTYYAKVTVTKVVQRTDANYQQVETTLYQAGVPKYYLDEACTVPSYGTPVFNNTRQGTGTTSLSLKATKTLNGRAMHAKEFDFSLVQTNASWQALTGEEAYRDEASNVAAADGQKSDVAFAPLTYAKAGVYYYEVRETAGTLRGVAYDDAIYHVTVVVAENAETEKLEVASTSIERVDARGKASAAAAIDFANTYTAEKTEATVKKVWDDAKNQDGKRPSSLVVSLTNGSEVVGAVTLTADNKWTATIDDLPKYDANDEPIRYAWIEGALPDGYTLTSASAKGTVTTLTNSYTTEKTDATVKKAWDDANNQDGLRPATILVQLTANGEAQGKPVELSASTGWTHTQSDLPKYADGELIEYGWTEVKAPEGYELTGTAANGTITTLTNTHKTEETSATVHKVWKDAKNRDGMRPQSIAVKLLANGIETGHTVTLSDANDWTATVEGLSKNESGEPIEYGWAEPEVVGYEPGEPQITDNKNDEGSVVGTITTLTNTHKAEKTRLTVTKQWDDNDNNDGKRPKKIEVTLSANGEELLTAELTAENNWAYTTDDLPVNDHGQPIVYAWAEQDVKNYTSTKTVDGTTTTFVNAREDETTSLTVKKTWVDSNDQDGLRPAGITVDLMRGKEKVTSVTLNDGNGWTATVEDLPVYEGGTKIDYTWAEPKVNGYAAEQNKAGDTTIELVNTHEAQTVDVSVKKVWNDANNQDGKRPEALVVRLSNDSTVELSEANDWTATVKDLPKYQDGELISYSWSEEGLPEGYVLTNATVEEQTKGEEVVGYLTTLTNSYNTKTTEATVTKEWTDANNQDGVRPKSLTVDLMRDTTLVKTVELSEKNDWTATVSDLDAFEAGKPVVYTWREASMPEGYELAGTATNGTITTLTNTHKTEETSASVSKEWVDANDQDGLRPSSITVELLANGEATGRTVTLSDANGWSDAIDGLPAKANGGDIAYTWAEPEVAGYTSASVVDSKTGATTLTNTHEAETVDVSVKKEWDDANNQDGLRPSSITVELLANGEATGRTVTLSNANDWTASVSGLPRYEGGKQVAYTWAEPEVEGYGLSSEETEQTPQGAFQTTLTNTHEVETTHLSVTKVWDDQNNNDGIRPASIEVDLEANGEVIDTVELSAANGWHHATGELPAFEAGERISYTWSEQRVAGYDASQATDESGNTTFTNTHQSDETQASVAKRWVDDNDRDGLRPASLVVELVADGILTGRTVLLNKENGWKATLDHLAKKSAGNDIAYTWSEPAVDGYESTSATDEGDPTQTILTNKHKTAETSAKVAKVWDDDNDRDGRRPAKLVVELMMTVGAGEHATTQKVRDVTLDEKNGWTAEVEKLPAFDAGQPIAYSWVEESLPEGYTLTNTALSADGKVTTLTNSYEAEKTSATVRKVWYDDADRDRKRPESITVQLTANGKKYGEPVELSAATGWTYTAMDLPLNEGGKRIAYAWEEDEAGLPEGYTLAGTTSEGTVTTLTNSYDIQTTEATVRKVWDDDDNRDGIRPESIAVTLSTGESVTLDEANGWQATIEDLPKYENGQEIAYSWTEAGLPAGYVLSGTAVEGTITTLTNSHASEQTEATVRKVWNDANDQDGLRPDSLRVQLMANGEKMGEPVTLDAASGWKATVFGLPTYEDGVQIAYTWAEAELPEGYELTGNETGGTITTLTNTHVTEETEATVHKVWDDDDNRDGLRPASIVVALSNGIEVTLSEANDWSATVEHLPKYANGAEVAYTWSEGALPEGYVLKSNRTEGTVTTITNRHDTATTEASVRKVWNDDSDRDGLRPFSIEVQLMANGAKLGEPVSLGAANSWTRTISGLPKYENGSEVVYTWEEVALPEGYMLSGTISEGTLTTITNMHETTRHEPQTTERSVRKLWDDNHDQDGIRPDKLTVELLANGNVVSEVELSDANKWTATVGDLPVYENDRPIDYRWTEADLPAGYVLSGAVASGNLTTLTNRHEVATTSAGISKLWNDANNQDGTRPSEVRVALMVGEVQGPAFTLSDANNWTVSVPELPKFDEGKPIAYSWVELSNPEGYVLEGGDQEEKGQATADITGTITNTHVTRTTSAQVRKVWDDANNQDGIRPSSLEVTLTANGVAVQSVELTQDNGWQAEVKGLAANANGEPIAYAWVEDSLPEGYTLVSNETEGTLTTLTNHHDTTTTYAEVHKVWDDANDQDGLRPREIVVDLVGGSSVVTSVELSEANDWSARVEGLPAFDAGQRISYAWQEQGVPVGYASDVQVQSAPGDDALATIATLTNRHATETTSASVRKVWEDEGDRDGMRPAEIELSLLNGAEVVATATLTEANDWCATISDLPKFAAGKEIAYTWAEPSVEGYELVSSNVNNALTTLTNVHEAEKTEATVLKVWNDDSDRDGVRPEELSVALLANGKKVITVALNAANGWSATVDDLKANEKGTAIAYTWEEEDVPAGYTLEGATSQGTLTTITNTHEASKTEATVCKVWDDSDDEERLRPDSIDVTLTGNGQVVASITLDAKNDWSATIRDLNANEDGLPINYVWTEDSLPEGYELVGSEREGTVTTLTNSLTNAPTASFGLTVAKSMEGRPFNEGDHYTFRVSAVGEDAPLPQYPVVSIRPVSGDTATVDFGSITFSHADAGKTFVYGIEETGSVAGVTNDPHTHRVEVTVADKGDGTLSATPTYYSDDEPVDGIEFANAYEATGSAVVEVRKSVAGRAWNEGETHEFALAPVGDAPMPEGAQALTATAFAEGEPAAFGALPFTSADAGKTYDYTIAEVLPTDEEGNALTELDGLFYDTSEHVAHVAVSDAGTGTLATTVTYDDGQAEPARFTNTYAAAGSVQISGSKVMENRAFNDADEYTFTLVAPEGTPLPENPSVTVHPTVDDPTFAFGPIAYSLEDAGNTYTYTLRETGTVAGVANDASEHTVQVTVADNGDGTLTATPAYFTDGEPAKALVFTNTYEAKGTYELVATKRMSGRAFNDRDTYTFTLETDSPDAPLPLDVQGNEVTEVTINPREGNVAPIDFGTITFDFGNATKDGRPVAYTYTIHESAKTSVPGVTNELASIAHWVTLVAEDQGDGTLAVRVARSGIDNDDTLDPATALTITNTYEATGEVVLEATKRLEGKDLEAGEFTFELEGDNVHQVATNDADGKVAFDPITYRMDQIGETYTYTIREVNEAKESYVYDEATHTAAVTVFDQGDGTLGTTVVYDDDTSAHAPEFLNSYFQATAELSFAKHFYGEGDEQFAFVLEGANDSWEPREGAAVEATGEKIIDNGQALRAEVTNGAFDEEGTATVALPKLVYGKPGTYRYVLYESPEKADANDATLYRITVVVDGEGKAEASYEMVYGDDVEPVEAMEFYNNALVDFAYHSRNLAAQSFMGEEASVQPKVGKRFEGGTLVEGAFRFALLDAAGTELQEATNDAEGTVAFDRLYFSEPGTYEYYLVEKPGSDESVVYDPATIRYVVTVTQNEAGELQVDEAFYGADEAELEVPAFVNSIRNIRIRAIKRSREAPYDPLVGSTYGMWMANADGNDVYMGNSVSNEDGELFYDIPVTQGVAYYLLEEEAPHGHLVDPYPTDYFTLGKNENGFYLVYQEDPEFFELVPDLEGKVLA